MKGVKLESLGWMPILRTSNITQRKHKEYGKSPEKLSCPPTNAVSPLSMYIVPSACCACDEVVNIVSLEPDDKATIRVIGLRRTSNVVKATCCVGIMDPALTWTGMSPTGAIN